MLKRRSYLGRNWRSYKWNKRKVHTIKLKDRDKKKKESKRKSRKDWN